jgi:hypothetical protein
MNTKPATQDLLFDTVRIGLSPNLSMVHEISELLEISYDSAYRRIRGEKELTIEELRLICDRFKISADSLFALESRNVLFNPLAIHERGFSFKDWLLTILSAIKAINSCKDKEIIYSAKDIPVFHYFEFPEVLAFKYYFWHKELIPENLFPDQTLTLNITEELKSIGHQIITTYNKILTSELWNEETFNSLLRQIEFCYISGFFRNTEDIQQLLLSIETMIRHLWRQAELGFRFLYGSEPEGIEGSYKLYLNEVLLGDNTIFTNADSRKSVYLTYNVINLLTTSNPDFCGQVERSLRVLMHKSTLISSTSAKERSRFFNQIMDKIKSLRGKLFEGK